MSDIVTIHWYSREHTQHKIATKLDTISAQVCVIRLVCAVRAPREADCSEVIYEGNESYLPYPKCSHLDPHQGPEEFRWCVKGDPASCHDTEDIYD